MFEQPAKNDIDTALSLLMHEARRQTLNERNRITSEAIKHGALQSNRVIVAVVDEADKIHNASLTQAKQILIDFTQRMAKPATEITAWARPHLENLSNAVLGVVPPNGFPADHQRIINQYRAVFQQRVDITLRSVEIGYVKGMGFPATIEKIPPSGPISRPSAPIAAKNGRSVIILTALDIETRAALRHLTSVHEEAVRGGTVFHVGQFERWTVAVAECGEGNVSAATTAERGINHFQPELALFVGVAGGVKDVTIGDAVVASKVYGYERGKDTSDGFKPRPVVNLPAYALEQRARAVRLKDDWQQRLDSELQHSKPQIYIGAIAAGEKVVAASAGKIAQFLKEHYGDTLAVEMEGQGFLASVHLNAPVKGCVIRGISDLLDGKADADKAGSQARAADVASAIAFEMLATLELGQFKGNGNVATKSYATRSELFRDIRFLLIDNHQIWKTYGPDSEEARRNPTSNAAQLWQSRKVSEIIPNNAKICAALDGGRDLLTPEEYAIAAQFKEHAAGFAANAIERVEGYPTFPQAFQDMVESGG